MEQIDELDDGELDEQKCIQKIGILPGPTKQWRIKRIDELNDDELDEFYCTRIVCFKKWFWNKFHNARSVRFQAWRTRYDTYVSLKISAKLLDEGDIRKVLNCWKWPQKLVLECHYCPLVTRFKPRSWHPNRC